MHKPALLLLAALALATPASAQTELQELIPGDPANWMNFGDAVALDGDVAVVGAPDTEVNGLNYAGAVYVYRRQANGSWLQEQKLTRPVPEIHDDFGTSVDVEGDLLVVGAPDFPFSAFTGIGAVYVYRRQASGVWTEEAELHGSTAGTDSGFGTGVSLSGTTIATGANNWNGGTVYVFDFNGIAWSESTHFQEPLGNGFRWDGFGRAVALQGDVLLVGGYSLPVGFTQNAGKAFIYRRTAGTWALEDTLVKATPEDGDWFGRTVALDGDLAVVGAPRDEVDGEWQAGSAHAYRRSGATWAFEEEFKPTVAAFHEEFGSGVAVQDNVVLVGGPGRDLAGSASGVAYVFRRDQGAWEMDPPFAPAIIGNYGSFGRSAAMDGDLALIGSLNEPTGHLGMGSAFLYRLDPPFTLTLDPSPPESGRDLDLHVRHGRPATATWIAYSLTGTGSTFVPQLQVTLGLAQPRVLFGPDSTDAQGRFTWQFPVPASAAGRALWLQAVQAQLASNVVSATVL